MPRRLPFGKSLISNRESLDEKGNCQLEAAGIAGTRTPSGAASNYQLCWFSLLRWNWIHPANEARPGD
jgi:hypothetical protein